MTGLAVYVDILFLRELLVDGIVLWTTAWVRHIRPNPWRMLASAAFGACYVVLMIFPQLSFMFMLAIKISVSFIMLWIAFGYNSLQHFLRLVAAFYGVNFVAAGAILGIYFLLLKGSDNVWRTMAFSGEGWNMELKFGFVYFITALSIGIYIHRSVLTQKRERELVRTHLAEVEIIIGENSQRCIGLIDTGNQLYDPLTRTPVMVTEASLWKEQLPDAWIQGIADGQVDRLIAGLDVEAAGVVWQDRMRLVPFRGVNRGSQFMLAIKPDSVKVVVEGQVMESKKVLIGLDGGKLTADGTYRAIIHPSMVQP
ncbi:sigma-E processing peptidase SpoIIGA [Paenibacillus sp. GXUN7292]|uniref:sigma-E processing peptidase SpoIIGA n=1 Tax=Paenibacillus sp. GXUN7292 TaxID=3422499 RepID=UPI003D7EBB19